MASRSSDSASAPADAASPSRRLPSILLDKVVHLSDSTNETTATADSRGGHTMALTFWMAAPPDVSFFSVHCSRSPDSKLPFFKFKPQVVGSEGNFVLFRAWFSRDSEAEYFMYKAGYTPWLERVPPPDDDGSSLKEVREFGILPLCQGVLYHLAALCGVENSRSDFQLRIYSSEHKSWTTRTLLNLYPGDDVFLPEKVITLAEGVLVWVDFWYGLVECDLRQDPPCVRFIPLPNLFPGNREKAEFASVKSFRDVACINGMLRFIELEYREVPCGPSDSDVLCDSDLIISLKRKDRDENEPKKNGWRVVTWSRTDSSDCWRKLCAVGVDDIFVDESTHLSLLSGPRGETRRNFTFRDLFSTFPTLSTDGDDVLYLKSMEEAFDPNGWIIAVDLGKKTVKELGVYSFKNPEHVFRTSMLSRHLSMTPGIEVSAYCKNTPMVSSAKVPNHKPVGVDGLIYPESRRFHRLLAEDLDCAQNELVNVARDEALGFAQNGLQKAVQNELISLAQCSENSMVESMCKIRRLFAENENIVCARGEAQRIVQRDHISSVHPVGNNLPSQDKWDGPCDPGYQLWSHQNNLAPHPSIKHHGYSEKLPAPNSFVYGSHSGHVNYKHQAMQLSSVEQPHAIASLQQQPPVQYQPQPSGVWT